MSRINAKLVWGIGSGALALFALQQCNAGNLFKSLCDRDRCHTPDCRELDRRQPECDCRFGHFTTQWAPWASNCPQGCQSDNIPQSGYFQAPLNAPVAPVDSPPGEYAPYPTNGFDATPYLPAPQYDQPSPEMSLPLPPEINGDTLPAQSPMTFPSQSSPPYGQSLVLPAPPVPLQNGNIAPVPAINAYPMQPIPSIPNRAGSSSSTPPMPRPTTPPNPDVDIQPPVPSEVPNESAFRPWRGSVQPTSLWQQQPLAPQYNLASPSNRWRVMPGYQTPQPQEPVMSQPFYVDRSRSR